MGTPEGRYRVEEKDGRLVVIDHAAGPPAATSRPPHLPRAAAVPLAMDAINRPGAILVRLVSRGYDEERRALIRWTWVDRNMEPWLWDAALDAGQQRRLGRALLAIAAGSLLFLAFAISGAWWVLGVFFFATIPWGWWAGRSIRRLRSETADQVETLV